MEGFALYAVVGLLTALALGGAMFAFAGTSSGKTQKRFAAIAKPQNAARALRVEAEPSQLRRKNMQAMLKEMEGRRATQKTRPSLRRRLEMAGLSITPRTYWIASGVAGIAGGVTALASGQSQLISLLAVFAAGFGLPRWVLGFLKNRREKRFTREFANAIDVITRSVRSGLPVNEAMKVVANEIPDPVGNEFRMLLDSQKIGVSLEDGLKRMYERMPTAEVNFFAIVMAIQQKSGGNLSEALQNLAGVLRDRKRLQGKIRAMSSEAKASAMIIGSLPPGVMTLIYITTPNYIAELFHTQLGNLMLLGCVVWMACGIFVMKRMVSFNY